MVPLQVVEAARLEGLSAVAEEGLVVLARHEADLLAVLLVGNLQSKLAGDAADLLLGQGSEREEGAGKLTSAQAEEEVGLVFLGIKALAQDGSAFRQVLHDRIMARRDVSGTERGRLVPEIAEFQLLVAHDAGVGGPARLVLLGEVIDHEALEGHGLVDHIVGDSQRVSHAAGIGDRLGTAAFILGTAHAVLRPEFHGDTDHFPTLFLQEPGGHARVNAAAHPHDDASGIGRWGWCAHGLSGLGRGA